MLSLSVHQQYYLFQGYADMRKGFDSPCGMVREHLQKDPLGGNVFVFISRRRNQIRPVAVGRKNYLLFGSHESAERAAIIYSLLETCKLHHVNPQQWLLDVLQKLPTRMANNIDGLLPQNWIANIQDVV